MAFLGDDFLNMKAKALITQRQTSGATLSCKASVQQRKRQMKRQCMEWEKTFASYISDNCLISKTYKEPLHSIAKKQITQLKNGQELA